eukprot:742167-Amphidinium_carterae.1
MSSEGTSELRELAPPETVDPVAWLYRLWWKPVERIGEAKNPEPLVCTCNPGGWSRVGARPKDFFPWGMTSFFCKRRFSCNQRLLELLEWPVTMATSAPLSPLGVPREDLVEALPSF